MKRFRYIGIGFLIVVFAFIALQGDTYTRNVVGPQSVTGKIVAYNGSKWRNVRIDTSTRSLQTISYEHHEIHSGSSYVVSDVQNVDTTTMQWMVTTPDTAVYAHMLFAFDCTGEMQIVVTEGADRTGTNALSEENRNRNSLTSATTVFHRAVSAGTTDGATTVYSHRSGSTGVGGKTAAAGGIRGANEFVLKRNTKYIVTITTYADVYVTAVFDWYEHTDKAE